MTQLAPQTHEQHRIAQEAGNAAWAKAEAFFSSTIFCADVYHTAYQKSLAKQQAAPTLDEIAEMCLMTRRIWDEAEPIEY